MVVPVPKIGNNRNLEQQGPSCYNFNFLGSNPPLPRKFSFLGVFITVMYFTGKDDGPTIEEYIAHCKAQT